MVINIGNGFDQYWVKLVMVQNKEADTAIDWHEGEIAGEVIVDDTADLSAKAPKQNTFAIDSSSGMMLTSSSLALYAGPG